MALSSHYLDSVTAHSTHAEPPNFPDYQLAPYQSASVFQPNGSAANTSSSNDFTISSIAPIVKQNSWATKESWDLHRPLIAQPYQKKPLAEVMRFMEREHAFRATVKMYKTHIKQWSLDKKNKEFEMRAIVRKNKQRSDRGKRSVIHVRSQRRDFAEIVRYWDRKGVSIDEVIARHATSPTPEAVIFSTPVPSPIMTPQRLAIPERILLCFRDYFKGSFESGTWIKTEPTSACRSIKDAGKAGGDLIVFYSYCRFACLLFSSNRFPEAGSALSIATAKFKRILLAEDPLVLVQLLGVLSYTRNHDRDEIALIVLRQFSAMGKLLLGSEHPLCRIAGWYSWVFNFDFDDVVKRCTECATGQLETFLGSMHWSTIDSRTRLGRMKGNGKTNIQMLQELLEECTKILQPSDVRTLSVCGNLAESLYHKGHYQEAQYLYQSNLAYTQEFPKTINFRYTADHDLHGLAMCQYALGKVNLGIATLYKAIDMGISQWGLQDGLVGYRLLLLEDWYCEQGFWGAAAQVHEWFVNTLNSAGID